LVLNVATDVDEYVNPASILDLTLVGLWVIPATDVDEYVNPASILDLTLVGLWVIPGHHVDALTIIEGAMIDNRNEYLYVLARGEGEERMLRPFAYARAEHAVQRSRRQALASFGDAFVREASQLKTP